MRDYLAQDIKKDFSIQEKSNTMRREERLYMARSAFGKEEGKVFRDENLSGSSGVLLRLVAAGMLFAVFAVLCYFDVSFHGYDREWLEQCLQNNHLWEQMTGLVADCVNRLR
ncbi:MAG: hypothetical protein J1E62_03905 [Lachnospiraceae bacterium]|nr:hypothetical protein [Lachnospiraceae bacterium]